MADADDRRFMRRALELAERGAGQVAPNPKVGAVVVRDGRIVGEGWHRRYGAPHAEVDALHAAGPSAFGATVYVSLEPCSHHGLTPPCTDALIEAGVARVVCATRDPNPRAAGGMDRLSAAGIAVRVGVCEEDALLANAAFLHHARTPTVAGAPLPFVVLKLAVSIDGAIVDASHKRGWLTGPEAHRAVHALRSEADAVAIGIGTALADDPALTVRLVPAPRVAPVRVVFDRHARLPLDSVLVQTAQDVGVCVVAHGAPQHRIAALEQAGVRVLDAENAREALLQLAATGVRHLLVEGGAELGSSLLAAGLVHHLIIFQAPVILGAGAVSAFAKYPSVEAARAPRLRVLERRVFGADLMTRYAVSGD